MATGLESSGTIRAKALISSSWPMISTYDGGLVIVMLAISAINSAYCFSAWCSRKGSQCFSEHGPCMETLTRIVRGLSVDE
jgi:hypothetical protein